MIKIHTLLVFLSITFVQQSYADEYFCNGLKATIVGTDGDDHIIGTPGDDVIVALGGDDIVEGGEGNDTICGNSGTNILRGGPGNDTIFGGTGFNTIYGDEGDDEIHGGDGTDAIYGGEGNDRLYGHEGRNKIEGGPGDDILRGGGEWDVLVGGEGDDILYGEGGNDELYGGPGADLCIGGEGEDYCDGGDPVTETIAEDDDLCHEDVEMKISCRGPGQPEFYELTYDQKITGSDLSIHTRGTTLYKYSGSSGLYNVVGGLTNLDLRSSQCVTATGTYRPINLSSSLFLAKSNDEFGRKLSLKIFSTTMMNVIDSTLVDSCNGRKFKNMPASIGGPFVGDINKNDYIYLNQNSLNVVDYYMGGPLDGARLDLIFTLKGKGQIFPEVEP